MLDLQGFTHTTIVKVFSVWRDVYLDGRVSIQATHTTWWSTQIERLASNVTIRENSEHTKNSRQVCAHVKPTSRGVQDLAQGDVSISWKIAIIRQQIQAWTRPTTVIGPGGLKLVAWLGPLVVGVDDRCYGADETGHGAHEGTKAAEAIAYEVGMPRLVLLVLCGSGFCSSTPDEMGTGFRRHPRQQVSGQRVKCICRHKQSLNAED